jgi:hypothetical protein
VSTAATEHLKKDFTTSALKSIDLAECDAMKFVDKYKHFAET